MTTFLDKLRTKWDQGKFVCVGLDQHSFSKNKKVVDLTFDLVLAYKPNAAFYEAEGSKGYRALERIVSYIRRKDPTIPIILDAKRADIGSTNDGYSKAYFNSLGVDAITVHPYLGKEAIQPFLNHKDKGSIILVKTSNPGAGEFQDLKVNGVPLYIYVAKQVVKKWNSNGNCAVVVGATYPKELKEVREIIGDMPILIPGIGAQGGDLEATLRNGLDSKGQGVIISSSRAIINAKSPRDATLEMHQQIQEILADNLTPLQKRLAVMLRETKIEAKVVRRRKGKNGSYEFYKVVRKTSPVDFRVDPGEFVFKHHDKNPSAPLSPMYVNLRNLPEKLLKQIAKNLTELPFEEKPDFCTGIPNAGDPLAESFSKESGIPKVKVFEKEEVYKGDVLQSRKIVPAKGVKGNGKKLLIVDDLITKAGSKIEAVEAAQKAGYKVVGVAILVDRQEGGAEEMAKKGYRLYSVMKLKPMLKFLTDEGKITKQQYKDTLEYLALSRK